MTSTVSVVIVTYDGWPHLRSCLSALRDQRRCPDEILVVDNGSRDGTVDALAREFPEVAVIEAGRNLGFAAGNNLGIRRAHGDVVVLLNNDVTPDPAFIDAVLEPLAADSAIGAVAASLVFSAAPDVVASAGIRVFANGVALDRGLGEDLTALPSGAAVFGASAGAAAYRRGALEDVGLFAEPFFMYLEDVDLAWRLRLRGWSAVHAGDAVARHAYSASSVEGSPLKRRLLARNRIWTLARCLPRPLLVRNLPRIAAYDAAAFGYALIHGDRASLLGRVEGVAGVPGRMQERRSIQSRVSVSMASLAGWLEPPPGPAEMLRLRRLTAALASGGRDLEASLGSSEAAR